MNRVLTASAALLVLSASVAEAKSVRLTGLIAAGSRICSTSGCQRVDDRQDLSVFVMRASGDVARVRHRGETFSVDADRVTVKLRDCNLKLKPYMSGAKCPARR